MKPLTENLTLITPALESKPAVKNLSLEKSANLRDHFPFSKIRPAQETALRVMEEWIPSSKKFLIAELPCGVGKSGLSMAAASYGKTFPFSSWYQSGGYVLSPQITLTQQYLRDFESMGLVELKGRANFHCEKHSKIKGCDIDCEAGNLFNQIKKSNLKSEEDSIKEECSFCPYKIAKEQFMASPLGVVNNAYYLNETRFARQLKNRTMIILDEGQNLENNILSLMDLEITQKKCDEYGLNNKLPVFNTGDNEAVLVWMDEYFMPVVLNHFSQLAKAIRGRGKAAAIAVKKYATVERFIQKLNQFRHADDPSNWFAWSDQKSSTLFVKPLTAPAFADDLLFSKAQKVLIMSATILSFPVFMRNLGIQENDTITLTAESDFPVENRPIYYRPVGNMSYKYIDETLPKMAAFVGRVLNKYADKKGIVHCHSHRVAKYIGNYLREIGLGDRILTHDDTRGSREAAVLKHIYSPERPTVLLSPSMGEGLDLKEDLSRFAIVCKVPYKVSDAYTRARMRLDSGWYDFYTALALIQSTGRSVRSNTDKAITYIADAEFSNFMSRASNMFPKWWLDAVHWN